MKGNCTNHPRKFAREEDVKQLIENLSLLQQDVEDIRDNHLLAIYQMISKLQGRFDIILPLLATLLGLVIANLFI